MYKYEIARFMFSRKFLSIGEYTKIYELNT